MTLTLRTISDSTKYPQLLDWYYMTNPISHELGYGRYARKIIKAHFATNSPFVQRQFLKGIFVDDKLVGFVLIYPADESLYLQQKSYTYLKENISRFFYTRRKGFYRKMAHALRGQGIDKGYYLHAIVIKESYRGQGIGTAVLEILSKKYRQLTLYVNDKNHYAVNFYLENGFKINYHGQFRYRSNYYGEYLMVKT